MIVNLLIFSLSLIGFYISLYFTLVYYGIISPLKFPIPQVCKLSENACSLIINTRYARILGLPNFVYGIFYYLLLILFAISNSNDYIKILFQIVALFVVAFGVYLIYVLIYVLRVKCILCLVSHIINFLLAVFLSLK